MTRGQRDALLLLAFATAILIGLILFFVGVATAPEVSIGDIL